MKLKEYINWANKLDEYQDSATLADLDAWGFEVLPGNYRTPKLNFFVEAIRFGTSSLLRSFSSYSTKY